MPNVGTGLLIAQGAAKLIMVGGCRNAADEQRVSELKTLCVTHNLVVRFVGALVVFLTRSLAKTWTSLSMHRWPR